MRIRMFMHLGARPSRKTVLAAGNHISNSIMRMDLLRTECTIFVSIGPLTSESNPRNIGRAVGGRNWIMNQDDHHELVPAGQIGELLIEGPILASGHLHDPERTAAAFVDDLQWAISIDGRGQSRRFYKTGDLVYSGPDDTAIYVGRKDSQVKLRGQRVDLQEIEYLIQLSTGTGGDRHTQISTTTLKNWSGLIYTVVGKGTTSRLWKVVSCEKLKDLLCLFSFVQSNWQKFTLWASADVRRSHRRYARTSRHFTGRGKRFTMGGRRWQAAEGQFNGSRLRRPANRHNRYADTERSVWPVLINVTANAL